MKNNLSAMKIKKMSHMLRIVIQIFFWASVIGTALFVIGGFALQFLQDNYFLISETGHSGFTLSMDGLIRYRINPELNQDVSVKPIFQSIAIMAAICSMGLAIVFRQLSKVLKTVEEDRPFAKENARRLSIIGIVLLIGSIAYRAAGFIVAHSIINTLNINNLDINLSIDGFMVLTGFMMLILGGIFKYGNYLQDEYDATL